MKILYFCLFLGNFPLLDPDPATQINADPDTDPDPQPWLVRHVRKTMVNGKSGNRSRALTRTAHKKFSYLKNEVENNQVVLEEDERKLLQEREEQLRGGNTKAERETV